MGVRVAYQLAVAPPTAMTGFDSCLGHMWAELLVDLNLTRRVFLRVLPFSSLLKIDSQLILSICGAMLRGHAWTVNRLPEVPSHAFGPTSQSRILVIQSRDCNKGDQHTGIYLSIYLFIYLRSEERRVGKECRSRLSP